MKKVLAAVMAMAMSVGAFTGCTSSNGASSQAQQPAAPADSSTAAPASSEAAPEKKPATITVVTTFAGEDGNTGNYQAAVKEWEAKTGNKVKDASAVSNETQKAKILSDFETGAEPDVLFWFNGVDASPIVEKGKVVSIEEIRKVYPDYATNMKDGMMGASPVDGKNYSVPVNGYWEGLFVNKAVLKQAGVEVPGADYTWDQFLQDCEKIKAAGLTPIACSLADVPHYWFEYAIHNYDTTTTHGIVPKTVDDANGLAWTNGISDIKVLYEKGYFPKNTLSAKDDDTFAMFVQDKAAFLIDGSWKLGAIEKQFGADPDKDIMPDADKIANFTVSYVPGKNDRKTTDIVGGLSNGYYISKKAWDDPDKQAAVVDFITFMTTDEMTSKFAKVSATALKNGTQVDESKLSTLAKDSLVMVKNATGMAPAVQDQVSQPCRVPLFDGLPNIVSGKVAPKDAVAECLKLIAEEAAAK